MLILTHPNQKGQNIEINNL